MPKSDAVDVLIGLVFVAIFLLMLATFGQMSEVVQGLSVVPSTEGYELAGSSRPAN